MSTLSISSYTLGDLGTNCYLVECPETRQAVIVDPAAEGDFLSEQILQKNLELTAILLTHGHYDHVLGLLPLKLNFAAPIYLHPADTFLLEKAESTAKHFGSQTDPIPPADFELYSGQVIPVGVGELRVIHTPGHTPGSVCFFAGSQAKDENFLVSEDSFLLSGDTLFKDGVGATNHHYSSTFDLKKSLQQLFKLPHYLLVYSGHGELTTIGSEAARHPNLSPTSLI